MKVLWLSPYTLSANTNLNLNPRFRKYLIIATAILGLLKYVSPSNNLSFCNSNYRFTKLFKVLFKGRGTGLAA